jgi:hypothetical protein
MCYPALWKKKDMYNFYEVHNSFISSFKKLIFEPKTSRLSLEIEKFLGKRGSFEAMDNFNIIGIYCSYEKPSYIPYYVSNYVCCGSVQAV